MFTNKVKTKHVPADMYKVGEDFDTSGALAFAREQAPASYLAVMLALQDRIADASLLVSNMATSKEHGLVAHAAGQLNALQELWDDLEQRRAEASKLSKNNINDAQRWALCRGAHHPSGITDRV